MKKTMIIAATCATALGLSACTSEESAAVDDESVETASDDAYAPETSVSDSAPTPAAPAAPLDERGDNSVRIGPDGAQLDINEGNVDASVNTDGDGSLEVEF